MMTFVKTIGVLSLTGSATFLSLLLIRAVLKKRLNATWFYRGMLVLLPFWVVPVGWLLPKASLMETVVMPQNLAAEWGDFSQEAGQALDLSWLGLLYGGIVSFLLVRFGVQYWRQRRRLLADSWCLNDPEDVWQLERLLTEHWIKRPVQLRCSPWLKTPVLLGLHHCTIILPNTALSGGQLRLVLAHEVIHLKRRDNWWKVGLAILQCFHWFDPVVYLMQRTFDELCELSCDEAVVSQLSGQQRKQYGQLILQFVQQGQDVPQGCSGLSQDKPLLKERLQHILQIQRNSRGAGCLFLLLLCFTCITGCQLSPKVDAPQPVMQQAEIGADDVQPEEEGNEQLPIETFSWAQQAGEKRINLFINGEEYHFELLEDGNALCGTGNLSHYMNALAELPKEEVPEDIWTFLHD